jgi:hypothetical protein
MEKCLLVVFIFFFTKSGAQLVIEPPPSKPFTEQQMAVEEKNQHCLHRNKYNAAERLRFYPFGRARFIKIVSFPASAYGAPKRRHFAIGLPLKKRKIDSTYIKEAITLTSAQTDSLTEIFYNTGYSGPVHSTSESQCFMPRNAVAFFDKKGKLLAYINISFACQMYTASSKRINIGELCTQKYELIKKFFISAGIWYGTIIVPD